MTSQGARHVDSCDRSVSVSPVDGAALIAAGRATGGRLITVEDHYAAGGIGDAVAAAVADAGSPFAGSPCGDPAKRHVDELMDRFGISAPHRRGGPGRCDDI
jgi:transketolase